MSHAMSAYHFHQTIGAAQLVTTFNANGSAETDIPVPLNGPPLLQAGGLQFQVTELERGMGVYDLHPTMNHFAMNLTVTVRKRQDERG
eukprot:2845940-Rhodomonas_salina.3